MRKKILVTVILLILVVSGFAGYQAGLIGSASQGSSLSSAASSSPSTQTSVQTSSDQEIAGGAIKHVIIVVMENEGYGSVIGNPSAPYQNQLASQYALAANYFAVSHPSLPNYLALVAGDTFGVTSDCLPVQCALPNTTITSLLDGKGLTWKEYAESMPANCSQTDSPDGLYVPKHDPFVYVDSVTGNSGSGVTSAYCDSHVVPFAQFSKDLASSNLPSYSFITPNLCDDRGPVALDRRTQNHQLQLVPEHGTIHRLRRRQQQRGVRAEFRRTGGLHPRLSLREARICVAGPVLALLAPSYGRGDIQHRKPRQERRDCERDVRPLLASCLRRTVLTPLWQRRNIY